MANNRRSIKYKINKADFDSRLRIKIEIKAVVRVEEDDFGMNQIKLENRLKKRQSLVEHSRVV